jgi:integrase
MAFAIVEGFRRDNPAVGIARIKTRSNGFHSWTEDEIAIFEARHPVGTKARLALALGLYTAQRRSDVIRMGRQHIADGMLSLRQQKTRTTLTIPVHPELTAIMAASSTGNLTFLVTEYGRPFTAAGFGGWFRKRCDEAGLPKECAFHGLRKAACTRLADAGCFPRQRHRLDQRACLSTGSGTLYQGGRPTPVGAHGHGHDENSKCQRRRSR